MKSRKSFKILACIIIFLVLIFLYSRYINTTGLIVKEIAVYNEDLNEYYNGFKIAHFSDIHYGRTTFEQELKNVINELNELNPDIVIFTGDLFDNKNISDKEKEKVINNLKKIDARIIKLAVIGDYDQKYLKIYKEILEESNFTLLDNTNKLIFDNYKIPINFIGITNYNSDIQDLYINDYFNITITHKPDTIKKLKNSDLTLAGHSLGGQIVIPFIGGIIKQNGANTYVDAYYKVNNKDLYISNGIGTQNYPIRLFNKPSITLYRLYKN